MSQPSITLVEAVDVRLQERAWPWREANRAAIERYWEEARQRQPSLFNGRIFLFADERLSGSTFHATCFEADYASLLYWKNHGFPPTGVSNGFAMAALLSRDGAFLLGVMGPNTANRGQVYFPAGTPDLRDLKDGVLDLGGSMMRELTEETGLTPADCEARPGWIVVRDGASLAFLRIARFPETADGLRERILRRMAELEEEELSDIRVVRSPDDIDPQAMPGFIQAFLRWSFAQST